MDVFASAAKSERHRFGSLETSQRLREAFAENSRDRRGDEETHDDTMGIAKLNCPLQTLQSLLRQVRASLGRLGPELLGCPSWSCFRCTENDFNPLRRNTVDGNTDDV